jgi:glycosyltransferase involved in cell wall biosynthesis
MKLCYLADIRLPTEKAHGLQIVENCDALARAGIDVTLVVPRRFNSKPLSRVGVHEYYGIDHTFGIRRTACVDLLSRARGLTLPFAAALETISFTVTAIVHLFWDRSNVYYSRDVVPLLAVRLVKPRGVLVYEAHQSAAGRIGRFLQVACVRQADLVIAVTDRLSKTLRKMGARQVVTLPDGFRSSRFDADVDRRDETRAALGVPERAFLIGYVGRLETMGMPKGLETVVEASAILRDPQLHLCVVGGPADGIGQIRSQWESAGLPPAAFHPVGPVAPAEVPAYLAACDACLLPLPWTTHFANDASPLKLFEYMAAGRAIIATSLPSLLEVLTHEETALLVGPDDAQDLARALARLRDDHALRDRLGINARRAAASFAWDARALRILEAIEASAGDR